MAETVGQRLILASASPRRAELLAAMGVPFDIIPSPHAEPELRSNRVVPAAWAQSLAYFKARGVADAHPGRWVLGADTIVACAGQILGKPRDPGDALAMLELQARHVSAVITGLSLVRYDESRRRLTQADSTQVWMRDDAQQRAAYVASGDWRGKAGAYGIQDIADQLVERIEGSFSNVVGLPLELLQRMLVAVEFMPNASGGDQPAPRRTPGAAVDS